MGEAALRADLDLPGAAVVSTNLERVSPPGGIELLSRFRQTAPTPILVLTMHSESLYVTRAFEAGAQGYVSKNASPDEVLIAIKRVAAGGRYIENYIAQALVLKPPLQCASLAQLARRDLEILRHLVAGRSLSEIASAPGIGYKTVANTGLRIVRIRGRPPFG